MTSSKVNFGWVTEFVVCTGRLWSGQSVYFLYMAYFTKKNVIWVQSNIIIEAELCWYISLFHHLTCVFKVIQQSILTKAIRIIRLGAICGATRGESRTCTRALYVFLHDVVCLAVREKTTPTLLIAGLVCCLQLSYGSYDHSTWLTYLLGLSKTFDFVPAAVAFHVDDAHWKGGIMVKVDRQLLTAVWLLLPSLMVLA